MILVDRVRRLHDTVRRAQPAPLAVRAGVLLCTQVALVVAYPMTLGELRLPLIALGLLPALWPRSRWVTVVAVLVVTGWALATIVADQPVVLWRVLAISTLLYLMHTLAALAAALPSDAVVAPDVLRRWLLRTGALVLASAVIGILILWSADRVHGPSLLLASVAGLVLALVLAAVLAAQARR